MGRNSLLISDMQIPFEHEKTLNFLKYLKSHYSINEHDVFCVGDELDNYFGGLWKKDPDALHTPTSEIRETASKLKPYFELFPFMRLAISNHGTRWLRKASEAEIPTIMLRRYRDIIAAPTGWHWAKSWRSSTKYPFVVVHGDDYGGSHPHIIAAMHNGVSTAIGHHHSIASIDYIKTDGLDIWAACCGSLIDFEKYAFKYAQKHKKKPQIGTSIVLDDGKRVEWIPLESDEYPLERDAHNNKEIQPSEEINPGQPDFFG
jgi:hypothetical protein